MTNYKDHHPTSFIGADKPLHAGITKQLCYNNLLSCYENSRYDYTASFGKTLSLTTSWAWIDCFPPPIPVYGNDEGFHDIDVSVDIEADQAGSIRCYATPTPPYVTVDSTLDDYTLDYYYQNSFTATNQTETFTISIDETYTKRLDLYKFNFIWINFAIQGNSAGSAEFRDVRYKEIIT